MAKSPRVLVHFHRQNGENCVPWLPRTRKGRRGGGAGGDEGASHTRRCMLFVEAHHGQQRALERSKSLEMYHHPSSYGRLLVVIMVVELDKGGSVRDRYSQRQLRYSWAGMCVVIVRGARWPVNGDKASIDAEHSITVTCSSDTFLHLSPWRFAEPVVGSSCYSRYGNGCTDGGR